MLAMKESLLDDDKNKKPPYPEPDVLQMIPYKPRQICREFIILLFNKLHLNLNAVTKISDFFVVVNIIVIFLTLH